MASERASMRAATRILHLVADRAIEADDAKRHEFFLEPEELAKIIDEEFSA